MEEQRIALVTGANKGIGFETCRQLGRQGITVLMGARNSSRGNAAAERLKEEGVECLFVHLDVTDRALIWQAERYVAETFGRLDILVNNAGMAHPDEPLFSNSAATISMKILRQTFDVNFFGAVELTQAMLPLIRKSPAGRIVNVASMLGSLTLHSDAKAGLGGIKPFAYDASKTALNAFTVHLAAALLNTPIKVNSAHPGWVKTDLGGPQAPMEPSEGAKTSLALATLGADGPTGRFFHLGEELPW